ncbi:hypothetical protein L1987_45515 [Smallanthus sonchifolius]|uniref:Uncharacterized protein n=1 Tax=Smallanthus sonchifolius TaxID=185202 RepID=A0ACB9FX76_9ASTR|nr:hypothetical protein L1987_45515 [Smallanthus sonchifolius]
MIVVAVEVEETVNGGGARASTGGEYGFSLGRKKERELRMDVVTADAGGAAEPNIHERAPESKVLEGRVENKWSSLLNENLSWR